MAKEITLQEFITTSETIPHATYVWEKLSAAGIKSWDNMMYVFKAAMKLPKIEGLVDEMMNAVNTVAREEYESRQNEIVEKQVRNSVPLYDIEAIVEYVKTAKSSPLISQVEQSGEPSEPQGPTGSVEPMTEEEEEGEWEITGEIGGEPMINEEEN